MSRMHWFVVLATLVYFCVLATLLPPVDDELYYWCWTEKLQLSYYDHAPMTAYMIWLSKAIWGDTLFGVRFPAIMANVIVLGILMYLIRTMRVMGWILICPVFALGAVLTTPDTPLLLFWSTYLLWLVFAHRRLTPEHAGSPAGIPLWHWTIGGVLLGCAVLGKYTAGLAGIASFASFLLVGRSREWLLGYIWHGVVAFLVASPILIFNYQHDFEPLRYQWNHAMAGSDSPTWKTLGEFAGVQIALFGTLPFVLLPWLFWQRQALRTDPTLRVCMCLFGLPFAFFLYKAARGPLEGNWALASYLAMGPLAVAWHEKLRAGWFKDWSIPASFTVPTLITTIAVAHMIHPFPFISPVKDRITRQFDKVGVVEQVVESIQIYPEPLPVYVETYQMASWMRFHGIPAQQLDGVSRPSHFTKVPHKVSDAPQSLVVWEGLPKEGVIRDAQLCEVVASVPFVVRGQTIAYYTVLLYRSGSAGGEAPPCDLDPGASRLHPIPEPVRPNSAPRFE